MTIIREKESFIQLLQSPPDSIKEKTKILIIQKEQLKHRLLTTESLDTTSIQENFTSLFDLELLNSNSSKYICFLCTIMYYFYR